MPTQPIEVISRGVVGSMPFKPTWYDADETNFVFEAGMVVLFYLRGSGSSADIRLSEPTGKIDYMGRSIQSQSLNSYSLTPLAVSVVGPIYRATTWIDGNSLVQFVAGGTNPDLVRVAAVRGWGK